MRLTIPHYYDFGEDKGLVGEDLVNPGSWDALRTQTSGDFALPATREEWVRAADEHPEIGERARRIDSVLAESDVRRVASYGVGGATLECWLHRVNPERAMVLGEYAPATIERLGEVFPEADVRRHDLLSDPPLDADLHLFHRIDTEFTNRQWRSILKRFATQRVLVIAGMLVENWQQIAAELKQRGGLRRTGTRAGLMRNRAAFEALWRRTHEAAPVDLDLAAWMLEPRAAVGGRTP